MEQFEGMTAGEAEVEIHSINDDPFHPCHNPDDPGHEEAVARFEELERIAYASGDEDEEEEIGTSEGVKTREELQEMMADPRYETDPEYKAQVDAEYKKAFPDEEGEEGEVEPFADECVRALIADWGVDDFDSRIDDAQAGMLEVAHETGIDLPTIFETPMETPDGRVYRMGNDPDVVKVFEVIGRKLKKGEDSMSFNFDEVDVGDEGQVNESRAALRTMMADPRYASDEVYRNRVDRLYKRMFPG